MPGLKDITSIWKNIKEIDLKPIRDAATQPVRIALVGEVGVGRHTLAEQMRSDPSKPGVHTQTPILFPAVESAAETPSVHLIIVMADATRKEFRREQDLVRTWVEAGKNVMVLINKLDLVEGNVLADQQAGWHTHKVLYGSVQDIQFLQHQFIPLVLEMLPQQHLALGRQFPLFRLTLARQLINDTCFSNAAYSFSTGLAEIVPVLDIPLNMTDMIVLTKSQAFLAYKLGLLVGFSTNWQDYVTEFGSVIGGGFLWRQIARGLIGLIPAWGIIPKVAVSYSGTYVVGNAILGWYLTGRNLSPKQMRALSTQAFSRGKDYARKLAERFPRPRLGRRKKEKLLEYPLKSSEGAVGNEASLGGQVTNDETLLESQVEANNQRQIETARKEREGKKPARLLSKKKSKEENLRTCPQCGKKSSADASFCQYCGSPFDQ